MADNDLSKKNQRHTLRKKRSELSRRELIDAEQIVCEQILNLDAYTQSEHIALYFAHQNEISLQIIWHAAIAQNKHCYFPALNTDNTLRFLPATLETTLSHNHYHILEPQVAAHKAINIDQLQLIFIPLLGFDKQCNRLGMGKGFYDKTLAEVTGPSLIGIAYEFQCLPLIKTDSWDIPLDAVITEKTIYWRHT